MEATSAVEPQNGTPPKSEPLSCRSIRSMFSGADEISYSRLTTVGVSVFLLVVLPEEEEEEEEDDELDISSCLAFLPV